MGHNCEGMSGYAAPSPEPLWNFPLVKSSHRAGGAQNSQAALFSLCLQGFWPERIFLFSGVREIYYLGTGADPKPTPTFIYLYGFSLATYI